LQALISARGFFMKSASLQDTTPRRPADKGPIRLPAKEHGHTAHFYSTDAQLVTETAQLIGSALGAGGAAVIVATPAHFKGLEQELGVRGFDIVHLTRQGRWMALDAAETLGSFMVEGWPDANRFFSLVGTLIDQLAAAVAPDPGSEPPPLAVFGEMVALLWEEGKTGASIRLEELWNELATTRRFRLSCGWPLRFFSRDVEGVVIQRICSEHDHVIPAQGYDALSEEDRRKTAVLWQLKSQALEEEIQHSRKTHQTLAARESELRDFLENAVIGMQWVGPDGTILWANRTVLELLGYQHDQFVGHSIASFIEPGPAAEDLLRSFRDAETVRGCEIQIRCGNGALRWMRIEGNPWKYKGHFLHTRCFVLDISQKKRADEAQMKLAAIVESADDAIASKDLDGIVTSWNAAAERILGWKAEEIVGKPITTIIPPELHGDEVEILRKIRAGERIEHFETVRITKGGERIDVSLTISPVRDVHGKIIGAAKILRDVTLQKKLQDALRTTERLAAVGRLAATVAHEINNPLEAVTNLIYLASTDPQLPQSARNCLTAADEELQRISHIARQTLGFYRDTTYPVQISVADAAEEVLAIYHRRFRYKRIEVRNRIPHGLKVWAFQGEFKQVISNLVSNAIDASLPGRPLDIRGWAAHHPRTGAEGVRLSVADRGTGIPEAIRRRIFTPFFTTKENIGTGLGLWIVEDLLSKKGGSIHCRSRVATPDQSRSGTVMMIFLPNQEQMPEQVHFPAAA
jgi:PAS domain S-box-containing protein